MSDTTDSTQPSEAEVRPEPADLSAEGSATEETSTSTETQPETSAPEDSPPTEPVSAEPAVSEEQPAAAQEAEAASASVDDAEAPAPVIEDEVAQPESAPAEDSDPAEERAAAEPVESNLEAEATETEAVAEEAPAPVADEAAPAETASEEAPSSTETEAAAEASESAPDADATEKVAESGDHQGDVADEPPVDPATLSPRQRRILELKTAMDEKLPVEGTVIGWNQGGFHISIDGVGAFVPSSLMELGPTKDPAVYLDQGFLFRVIKHQKQGRRIVLSRVPVLRELRRKQLGELRGKLEVGATLEGKVSSLTGFGVFVDLGGLEGLVHVSELSHQRIGNPAEMFQVGQEVQVKVLKIEKKGKRISLSMKALEPDPWADIAERFGAGKKFSGKVLRHADFGIFIELEPGIEGLLHSSQLRPGMKADDASLAAGAEIEGWVRVCEPKRQRLSLSLREVAEGDPWVGVEDRYPDGKLVTGRIEQIAPFGAFILLEPGLTGLLPQSEMRIPKGADPRRQYAPGQEISIQVVEIDRGRRRLSLALEGARVEGSKADIAAFKKAQKQSLTPERGGLNALAAAFEKARKK